VPAGHGLHASEPAFENVPEAHVPEQELVVRPVAAPNFPAGQLLQVPSATENFPRAQIVHVLPPPASYPAAQTLQSASSSLPVASTDLLTGQVMHVVPVADTDIFPVNSAVTVAAVFSLNAPAGISKRYEPGFNLLTLNSGKASVPVAVVVPATIASFPVDFATIPSGTLRLAPGNSLGNKSTHVGKVEVTSCVSLPPT